MKTLEVLMVEDSEDDEALLLLHLSRSGYDVKHHRVQTAETMKAALAAKKWDIVLSDYQMPSFTGLDALQVLKESGFDIPFILISGTIGEEIAVKAMLAGVSDYMMKGNLARLVPAIERELKEFEQRRARRKAERDLQESEKRLQLALAGAEMGVWEWNLQTDEMYWSPECYELLNFFDFERHIKNFKKLVHPEDLDTVMSKARDAIENQTNFQTEFRVINPRGELFWLSGRGIAEYDDQGQPFRLIGVIADITERKRVEEALRESESRLRLSQQVARIGTWDFNVKTNESVWSDGIWLILGLIPDEIQSNYDNWVRFLHPQDVEVMEKAFKEAIQGNGVFDTEYRIIRSDGRVLWLAAKGTVIRNKKGEPVRVLGVNIDITDRREAEENLHRSEEKLRQAQKLESVGRLAGGIAHDFNNMLTAINGYSQLALRRMSTDDPLRRNIEEIKKAGERSASLTHQLLAFSRQQVLQPEVLNLNQIIFDTTILLRRLIGEDVLLNCILSPNLGSIKADPGQMTQVIMNLAVNSRDAMPQGGTITIETENVFLDEDYVKRNANLKAGHYVLLLFSDTGCGIDENALENIFEPFYTTKEIGMGTGLGLSTTYGVISQSGGQINVKSTVGLGTTFEIYLPRVEYAAEKIVENIPADELLHGRETVLLVEDEPLVRGLTREILEAYDYKVIEAQNGEEAMEICRSNNRKIDLLLTDIVMPKMSGYELAEQLLEITPKTRVLFTSGYAERLTIKPNLVNLAANFIQKPYTPESLTLKIREILGLENV